MDRLKHLTAGLVLVALLLAGYRATPATATSGHRSSELLVKFQAQISPSDGARIAAAYGGRQRGIIERLGVHVLSVPPSAQPSELADRLRRDRRVVYVEPNAPVAASGVPNDPGYPNQWGLATVKAPQGWDLQSGRAGTIIAVVDTGIDPAHPDLSQQLVPGWNYDPFSPGYSTADTSDNNGHGTHVAGIAAARTNNGVGVAGTCPGCSLMPVKVLGADGSGTYDAVASGIIYAADHGATIINLSLGGTTASQTLQDAVAYASGKGVLMVAAAGNDGTNAATYPAALSGVMAVAATDSSDRRASFSNFNSYISVAAPGVDIYSTYRSATAGSTYAYLSGTSMASPLVAGLAGLLASQDATRTSTALRSLIEQSADDVDAPGWDPNTGYGRVNVAQALSGTISGRVTDAVSGVPLAYAQVDALRAGQVVASAQTRSDGTYRLLYLPAGSYDVRVTLAGYAAQTQTGIVATTGHVTPGVDFVLARPGAISGMVTSGRKALPGASVQALQGTRIVGSAVADASGSYQIANLPAGTYSVAASAQGFQSQTRAGIAVNGGQTTTGVNFSLSK